MFTWGAVLCGELDLGDGSNSLLPAPVRGELQGKH